VGVNNGAPLVAVAADGRLFLMDPADPQLADLPGWQNGKDVGEPMSGRPAFGEISGALAVAVGTDLGRGLVYRVSDGSTLSDASLGMAVVGAPAVAGTKGDVYWAVQTADGPVITHQRVGGGTDSVSLGGAVDSIVASPAVWNNLLVIGTSTAAKSFRVDPDTGVLTPQTAGAIEGDDFNTSPVLHGTEGYIGAASGKVYRINLTTGAAGGTASLPETAAPLSDPFYDNARDAVVFGGADGTLYRVSGVNLGVTSATVGSLPLGSPVVSGADTLVVDSGGVASRLGAATTTLSLNAIPGRALGVVRGAVDQAFMNTADGAVVASPLS
jgi:hypothetical protein